MKIKSLSFALLIGLASTIAYHHYVQAGGHNSTSKPVLQGDKVKFINYQKAIYQEYDIDLNQFEQQLRGGFADNQPITKYRLDQLLKGIEIELEHTDNKYKALEITTDHLEEIPDYYTRLLKMEQQAFQELGIEDPHHH